MAHAPQQYKSAARGAVIDIGVILALVGVSSTILAFTMGVWAVIFLIPLALGAMYAVIMRLFHRIEDLIDKKAAVSDTE